MTPNTIQMLENHLVMVDSEKLAAGFALKNCGGQRYDEDGAVSSVVNSLSALT